MFSKFTNISNIFHQAVEALAPQLTLYEEFLFHWKSVTAYFIDNRAETHRKPVEQTSIPAHLDQLLAILQEEENGMDSGATGPCMEYLLQHKLLETLYSLGRTDHPPGMKQIVLVFFTKLLSRLKQPLLPHVSVHRAVHRLVKVCGEVKAAPTETDEIQFLCTVCAKIRADPYLVSFFIEVPKKSKSSSTEDQSTNCSVSVLEDYSLVNSLLSLIGSADGRVAVKACEGLMLCASLPENNAANCLISSTSFCNDLTEKLILAYHRLPDTVDPTVLEDVEAKWGLDVLTDRDDQQTFHGKRQLVSFLSWLDYCDQLIEIANPIIAKALAKYIREVFLNIIIEPSILQQSECGAILSTAYLTRCLRTVCSHALLSEFCHFILGDGRNMEVPEEETHILRKRLIERCDHLSDEMSLVTLKLFGTLLHKDDEHILYNLILRNLVGRRYYKEPALSDENTENIAENTCPSNGTEATATATVVDGVIENGDQCCDIVTKENGSCEKELEDSINLEKKAEGSVTDSDASALSTPSSSPGHKRTEVHKIVNSFLSLLPEEVKSSYQTVDSGYDMYLRDAHKQFTDINAMCKPWNWPKQLDSEISQQSGPENDTEFPPIFYEGFFLKTLLDRVTRLLDQSYTVNLELTSVIARLTLVPHPNLHEFMLDPFLPVKDGVRTLSSVFQKVGAKVRQELSSHADLSQRLGLTRKKLIGLAPTIHRLEGQSQLEAIIVLEEFCKELSAIAFVKHHAAVTQD